MFVSHRDSEMSYRMDRRAYAETYGATTGDRIRLADTELWIEVERDFTTYGVGSIELGKLADLCLWQPAFFGMKPEIV